MVEDRLLGRVNGTVRFFEDLFQLGGTIGGGLIAEAFGLRMAMAVGLLGGVVAIGFLWSSLGPPSARRCRTGPEAFVLPADEIPLTE